MKREFTIRDALPEDAEAVGSLLRDLGYPNIPEFARSKIVELSSSEKDRLIVAEVDGAVVGMAHLHVAHLLHEPGCLGRVMAIAVSDNHRRTGVGRELMEYLETVALGRGCVKMELTSGAHRDGAHAFYENLGYVEKPRRYVKKLL